MADDLLIIDDRRTGDLHSALGTDWRLVTDAVMGGVSSGTLVPDSIEDKACLRLRGDVRLENNGGFVQAALDVKGTAANDASAYEGVLLEVYGNDEEYKLHLRTRRCLAALAVLPCLVSCRSRLAYVRLPFAEFESYRIRTPLNPARLQRVGVVAIGRAFTADLCVARVALYREAARSQPRANNRRRGPCQ